MTAIEEIQDLDARAREEIAEFQRLYGRVQETLIRGTDAEWDAAINAFREYVGLPPIVRDAAVPVRQVEDPVIEIPEERWHIALAHALHRSPEGARIRVPSEKIRLLAVQAAQHAQRSDLLIEARLETP